MYKVLRCIVAAVAFVLSLPLVAQTYDVSLAAIAEVNVTLGDDCTADLILSEAVLGDFDLDGDLAVPAENAFTITILDSDPTNGPIIDGCGTYVFTVAAADTVTNFTVLEGSVTAEDKTSPVLDFLPMGPTGLLVCDELPLVDVNELPAEVSRCFLLDGTTGLPIASTVAPELAARIELGGGYPVATDNCAPQLEVCVSDILSPGNFGSLCSGVLLSRNFTINELGCPNSPDFTPETIRASYNIRFAPIGLDAVDTTAASRTIRIECSDLAAMSVAFGDVPGPGPVDLPFFTRSNGETQTLEVGGSSYCNIGLTFEDSPAVFGCAEAYTVVRTYTLTDACDLLDVRTYTQVINVGDFTAPEFTPPAQDLDGDGTADEGGLRIQTNIAGDCSAIVQLDAPGIALADNCSNTLSLNAAVFAADDLGVAVQSGYTVSTENATPELTAPLAAGEYVIRYTYSDACGNTATADVPLEIVDGEAPAAICENGLNVTLSNGGGGNGTAEFSPEMLDAGSMDNCVGDLSFAIAEVVIAADGSINPVPGTSFGELVSLECEDVGTVNLGLRVTDAAGNTSFCETEVLVESDLELACEAPLPVTMTCTEYQLMGISATPELETPENLDASFGAAQSVGSCNATVEQSIFGGLSECGEGTLVRSFTIMGADGEMSTNPCTQVITVVAVPEYTIAFPGDRLGTCDEIPDELAVTVQEGACDMIVTTVTTERRETNGLHCYDLAVTYRTINLCEFTGIGEATVVPRDYDSDGNLDEPTFVHLFPNQELAVADDVALLDNDGIRNNGGFTPALVSNYGSSPNRGGFIYTQIIRVRDGIAPSVAFTEPATCFALSGVECTGTATLAYSLTDECTEPTFITNLVELDIDYNGATFIRTRFLVADEVEALGDGTYALTVAALPEGEHAIRVNATDECGNTELRIIPICVDNVVNATPLCINQIATVLQPNGNGEGTAAVWAMDFVPGDANFCGEEVTYSIYTREEALEPGFSPGPGRDGLLFDCSSDATVPVRVYAFNEAGEGSFCSAIALVQGAERACVPDNSGMISGMLSSEGGLPVEAARVSLSSSGDTQEAFTAADGTYAFSDLPLGDDYTVSAELNDYSNHGLGVTTADLVFITRYILGLVEVENPYTLLAADVSNDQAITLLDIIFIQRLILGLDEEYANSNAFRFISGPYVFPVPANPWATSFPEVFNINNLSGNFLEANLIGIMMGDVTGNGFNVRAQTTGESRSAKLGLLVENQLIQPGSVITIPVRAGDLAGAFGLQGTVEIEGEVEVVQVLPGVVSREQLNLNYQHQGVFSFVYHNANGLGNNEVLFSLQLRAREASEIASVLRISDVLTVAEATLPTGNYRPKFEFSGSVLPAGNIRNLAAAPNPTRAGTNITFVADGSGPANLTVRDITGRIVLQRAAPGGAGSRAFRLEAGDLPGTGVYLYTVELSGTRHTARLVVQ